MVSIKPDSVYKNISTLTQKQLQDVKIVESKYLSNPSDALKYALKHLPEDIYEPTLKALKAKKFLAQDDAEHEQALDTWKVKLNPFQKVANALLGDHATRLGVPAKPEHPDVISARKAAENKLLFSLPSGFTGHDN